MTGRLASPLVVPWHDPLPPAEAFRRLAALPHVIFFYLAMQHATLGRYSYITADPFDFIRLPADGSDGLQLLAQRMAPFAISALPGLPPFQGGAAGLFSYDLGRSLERVPRPRFEEFTFPALAVGFYDFVLAYDHQLQKAWFISHGLPEKFPEPCADRAQQRLKQFQRVLAEPPQQRSAAAVQTLTTEQLAPSFPVPGREPLRSNFSADSYLAAVGRAIEYIHAGDVFQVNLAQRLLHPAASDSISLYLRLRERNPATFATYFDLGETQIISASPERFLQVQDRRVEARPIKGTRPRTARAEADLFAGSELQESEKDRAENVMIVDLLRNDLSRVCRPDSVRVTQLCGLESYQFVQHLVSVVEGELEPGRTALDLVRAAFPGGSITGAPKVRAMEIISELEPTARGPYCGSIGYLGFDGTLDMNILIRTITASRGWWQFPVGGGIVAQSSPEREYEETWHKAAGLLRALI